MFGKRAREIDQLLAKMDRQLDLIYVALIIRDPGTSLSADAYEGLRKQVVASSSVRRQHVAQLAEIDVALRRGASAEDLAMLVTQWLNQAGVQRIEDPSGSEVWETTLPAGVVPEVDVPAYVDLQTGGTVRQGRLKQKLEVAPIVDEAALHSHSDPGVDDLDASSADDRQKNVSAESPHIPVNDKDLEEK